MRKKAWKRYAEHLEREIEAAQDEARHLRAERRAYRDEIDRLTIQLAGARAVNAVAKMAKKHRERRPYIDLGG